MAGQPGEVLEEVRWYFHEVGRSARARQVLVRRAAEQGVQSVAPLVVQDLYRQCMHQIHTLDMSYECVN